MQPPRDQRPVYMIMAHGSHANSQTGRLLNAFDLSVNSSTVTFLCEYGASLLGSRNFVINPFTQSRLMCYGEGCNNIDTFHRKATNVLTDVIYYKTNAGNNKTTKVMCPNMLLEFHDTRIKMGVYKIGNKSFTEIDISKLLNRNNQTKLSHIVNELGTAHYILKACRILSTRSGERYPSHTGNYMLGTHIYKSNMARRLPSMHSPHRQILNSISTGLFNPLSMSPYRNTIRNPRRAIVVQREASKKSKKNPP